MRFNKKNAKEQAPSPLLMPTNGLSSAFSLQGRTALVTGSSSGIGLACGLALKEAGAEVLFHGRETRPPFVPPEAAYAAIDLVNPEGPAELLKWALSQKDEIDLLVLCAGGFFDIPFLEVTPAIWERTFALNVRSAYFIAQAFARHRGVRGGAVVLVSSTNGLQAESDSTVYDTSKGALIMMTRTLALALAPLGIRVNGLAPGLIRTSLTEEWIETNHALRALYESKILLGRIGRAEDCASACVFLCSEAAGYVTGHTLVVDGGLTCGQVAKGPANSS